MSYARFIVLFIVLDIIEIDNSEILSEENQPLMFTGQWKLTSLTLILQTEVEPRWTGGCPPVEFWRDSKICKYILHTNIMYLLKAYTAWCKNPNFFFENNEE